MPTGASTRSESSTAQITATLMAGLRRELEEAIDEHDDQRQTDIANMIEQGEIEVDKERERGEAVAR